MNLTTTTTTVYTPTYIRGAWEPVIRTFTPYTGTSYIDALITQLSQNYNGAVEFVYNEMPPTQSATVDGDGTVESSDEDLELFLQEYISNVEGD